MTSLWSKWSGLEEPYPILAHLLDTGASALVLWDMWLREGLREQIASNFADKNQARSVVAVAAALHDIGKVSPVFQAQLANPYRAAEIRDHQQKLSADGYPFSLMPGDECHGYNRRHEQVSGLHLGGTDLEPRTVMKCKWAALSALGHHGKFTLDVESDEDADCFLDINGSKWQQNRDILVKDVCDAFDVDPRELEVPLDPVSRILVAGLVVVADHTASEDASITHGERLIGEGLSGREWVLVRQRFFSERIHHTLGVYQDLADPLTDVLGEHANTPRKLQENAQEVGEGLWLVAAPTGTGKTEAAMLRHASARGERISFVLPTQATTNAMMRRVEKFYPRTRTVGVLAHSGAQIDAFYEEQRSSGLTGSTFTSSGLHRLLGAVMVGTVDQVLTGALTSPWAHVRLLAVANSHLVVDEAHLLDRYQSVLFTRLLTWLGVTGTRVTVLSATLPSWQREAFTWAYNPTAELSPLQYPAHEAVPPRTKEVTQTPVEGGDTKSLEITCTTVEGNDTTAAHVEWVEQVRRQSPKARLGIVVNIVDRAKNVASELTDSGEKVHVLHSRMTLSHRAHITRAMTRELGPGGTGERIVVVGTQAIEASLDIDTDAMSTDLAPAASIIQRVGRAWRHDDPRRNIRLPGFGRTPLHIVQAAGPGGHYPYFAEELHRTWGHISDQMDFPRDSQPWVEAAAADLSALEKQDASGRIAKAGNVTIDMERVLAKNAALAAYTAMTGGKDQDENDMVTRLIEGRTARVILLGDGEWLWPGTVHDLEHLRGTKELKTILGSSLSLNGKFADAAIEAKPSSWNPKIRSLRPYIPIEIGDDFTYDHLGLDLA